MGIDDLLKPSGGFDWMDGKRWDDTPVNEEQELNGRLEYLRRELNEKECYLKKITEQIELFNNNRKEIVKYIFNDIFKSSKLYKRKSLKIDEIINLLS